MAITAAAGPISNLLLAFLCLLLFVPVLVYAGWTAVGSYAANFLYIMVMINVPVILFLSRPALAALKDYAAQRKTGRNPVFKASSVGLKEKTDYWN